jgi:hypothetical protein
MKLWKVTVFYGSEDDYSADFETFDEAARYAHHVFGEGDAEEVSIIYDYWLNPSNPEVHRTHRRQSNG